MNVRVPRRRGILPNFKTFTPWLASLIMTAGWVGANLDGPPVEVPVDPATCLAAVSYLTGTCGIAEEDTRWRYGDACVLEGLGSLVLTARAFPVPFRTENTFAEQAVFLRPVCTIINRLRLTNLAERPTANVIRTR